MNEIPGTNLDNEALLEFLTRSVRALSLVIVLIIIRELDFRLNRGVN